MPHNAGFRSSRLQNALPINKDSDHADLVQRLGPPPQLVWVTCGNVTNANLKAIFLAVFEEALRLLGSGQAGVEIFRPRQRVSLTGPTGNLPARALSGCPGTLTQWSGCGKGRVRARPVSRIKPARVPRRGRGNS